MADEIKPLDPTFNVRSIVNEATERLDDLRKAEVKRIDEKITSNDEKYQIQFADSEKAVISALIATKENGNKADQTNEKRFDAVNESYSKLSEQQTKLLARTEYESNHRALIEKIDGVESRINRTEGASNIYVTQTDLTTALDNQSTKFEIMLRPVVTFMNSQQGKSSGLSQGWGFAFGVVGIIIAILTVMFKLFG